MSPHLSPMRKTGSGKGDLRVRVNRREDFISFSETPGPDACHLLLNLALSFSLPVHKPSLLVMFMSVYDVLPSVSANWNVFPLRKDTKVMFH